MSVEDGAYNAPAVKRFLPREVLLGEAERLLAEGREVLIVTNGRSMLPFIRGGIDKVLLRRQNELKVGDIALARVEGRYIMHRVIAINGQQVTLMGDGNLQGSKEQTTRDEVVGVVMEIITPDGRQHKPTRGWLWRKLLPIRKYLLKIYRKWNKLKTETKQLS